MIDLHTHTTHSDGTFDPEQLVQLAVDISLKAIAITDHDTVDGISPAISAAQGKKLQIIPGVELSVEAELPEHGHLHLLGLLIDHTNPQLNERLDYLRTKRIDRVYAIIEKLNDLGFDLSTDDLHLDTQVSIGRPHIARILVNHGYVTSLREAFEQYLSTGKPAFVAKKRLSVSEAVDLIHNAGGLAILAHPISLGFKNLDDYGNYIQDLISAGLDGIELYSSFHPPKFTEYLNKLVIELNLIISGGSDFHGANKPEIELGRGTGNLEIKDDILVGLERAQKEKIRSTKQEGSS